MGSRFGHTLRAIVSTIAALAVWLVAPPAFAGEEPTGRSAAPQCDTRGATTFAPAPTLDPPQASIDITGGDDATCVRLTALESFRNGAPNDDPPPARTEVIVPRSVHVAAASSSPVPHVREHASGARTGVRSLLERPPQ